MQRQAYLFFLLSFGIHLELLLEEESALVAAGFAVVILRDKPPTELASLLQRLQASRASLHSGSKSTASSHPRLAYFKVGRLYLL